tara:strand:+ start:299 stop:460 length:162 start_codon:yes stop_codon:yes gene_type:complete
MRNMLFHYGVTYFPVTAESNSVRSTMNDFIDPFCCNETEWFSATADANPPHQK